MLRGSTRSVGRLRGSVVSDALAVLGIAPTPPQGRRLSKTRIAAALRRGGRQRRLDERATEIHGRCGEHLQAPPVVAEAMGAAVGASLVAITVELVTQIGRIETELADRLNNTGRRDHPLLARTR